MNAIERGAHADKLINDELLKDSFEQLRQSILKQLEDWPLDDPTGAEKLRISLKLLRGVRTNLETAVRDGKLAAYQLQEERKREAATLKTRFQNWRQSRG